MLDRSLMGYGIACGWIPPSLLLLKVISKVTKLKMGIYHNILFIIGINFIILNKFIYIFVSRIFVDSIINLLLISNY